MLGPITVGPSGPIARSEAGVCVSTVSTVGGSETGPADQTGPTKPGRRFSWISPAAREGFVLAPEAWSPTLLMVLTEPHRS
jgi:hypothetical protein